jgi:hypothetical protein
MMEWDLHNSAHRMALAIMNVDPAIGPGLQACGQKRRFSRHATAHPGRDRSEWPPPEVTIVSTAIRPPGSLMKLLAGLAVSRAGREASWRLRLRGG